MYSIFKMSFADGSDGSALTCLIHLVMKKVRDKNIALVLCMVNDRIEGRPKNYGENEGK